MITFVSLGASCESISYNYAALNCNLPIPDLQWNCGIDNVIELFINESWLTTNDYTWFVWEHDPLGPTPPYVIAEGTESFFDIDVENPDNSGIYKVTAYTFQNGIASCKSLIEFVIPVMNQYVFNPNSCSYTVGILSPDSEYNLEDIIALSPSNSLDGTLSNGEVASIVNAALFTPIPGFDYGIINFGQISGDSQEEITYSLPIFVNGGVCNINSTPLDVEPLVFTSASELETDIVINSGTDIEWLEPKYLAGTLTIESGASLTIMNGVEFFDQNAGILVEAGGSLYIEGNDAILRARGCGFPKNKEWKGITIDSFGALNDFEQMGLVRVTGGATIQDAIIAIQDKLHTIFDPNSMADFDVGGAKIQLENASFINNQVAVKMHRYDYQYNDGEAEYSYIRNCMFDNRNEFLNGEDYDSHIILSIVRNLPPIYGNTFKTTTTDLEGEEKGTAIRLLNSNIDIGLEVSYCDCDDNIFQNMYKGIDAYSLGDINSSVHIWNNFFLDNTKAVTINSSNYLTIQNNEFHIPAGEDEEPNDSYGIWMDGGSTYEILNNSFETDVIGNEYTRGLIIRASSLAPKIVGNYFDGNFTDGTRFEEENTSLRLNCNGYNNCQTDWHLDSGELGAQGEGCDDDTNLDYMNLSFNNNWSSQTSAININNQSGNSLNLYHDSSFDLNNISTLGNVSGFQCTNNNHLNEECDGISFPWILDPTEVATIDPCGLFLMVLNIDDLNNVSDANISYLTHQLIRNRESEKAFQLLDCVNRSWANRLLVTSYLQSRDLDNAEYYLNRLNDDTAEDIAFYGFYSMLIQGMRQGGTGKKQGNKEKLLSFADQTQWPNFKSISESALAIHFSANYNRGVRNKSQECLPKVKASKSLFSVSPNPANDRMFIDLFDEIEEPINFILCDLTGNIVKKGAINGMTTELNLADLEAGVYFCSLVSEKGSLETQKLIVLK